MTNNNNVVSIGPLRDFALPNDIEVERLLLGAMMNYNQLVHTVRNHITPDMFFEYLHQEIYKTIVSFVDKDMLANGLTIHKSIDTSEFDVDLLSLLKALMANAFTPVNIVEYCKVLKKLYIRRCVILEARTSMNEAINMQDQEVEAEDLITNAMERLQNLGDEIDPTSNRLEKTSVRTQRAVEQLEYRMKNQGKLLGISTGFTDLDKILNGLQKSDLVIIAGRPAMGKSSLGINIATNAADYLLKQNPDNSGAIAYYSLEMSADQLIARMLAMQSNVNLKNVSSGNVTDSDLSKYIRSRQVINERDIHLDDSSGISIQMLRTKIKRLKMRENLKAVFVDYLQLLNSGTSNKNENRVNEITKITQGLKAIAKEVDIPIIALSQLSRNVESRENKRPHLSDLRESGSIEQDADIVMFIYREEYYLMRDQPEEGSAHHQEWQKKMNEAMSKAEIIIAKHRNGETGKVNLHFDARLTKFNNFLKE